ncbi:MAG: hypothetical protein A3J48_01450 [Candidatus Doudnabacteria bacterium RIFCSPHIGHO2_02_FULL_46_11]|uniref:GIY-YIG domain-containing protein n=1 Tax=Candidatus Doudnabacteria bacterium RIFCSPHIGHO2_02_FULL_46_11 TaxID=1817832 RepID=A0A1F5P569_9BACT|nr:MAG: hypothetical protein A3J48_01450 [Candidatus Doudnabacteria bacterium RIFCSPHIGHO2_02_FULL_46_11]
MWYVYVLRSLKIDANYRYVGMSDDLRKRLHLHNQGNVFSTQGWKPLELIYYQAHKDKRDAAAREKFLKTGWGKNWIDRTLNNYLKKVGRTR